jgi:hypothetical protein
MDPDCDGIDVLQDAPVNADSVEGLMGRTDYFRHKTQAHLENAFGMTGTTTMQLFPNKAQAMDRTEQRQKKKNKKDWVAIEDAHSLTRWADLPRPRRIRILQLFSKNAKGVRRRKRDGLCFGATGPPLALHLPFASLFPL